MSSMDRELRTQLIRHMEKLHEQDRRWRDRDGKLYGCGPDAAQKIQAVTAFARAHGWRFSQDDDGDLCLRFDEDLAKEYRIPPVYWPEDAGLFYRAPNFNYIAEE